MGRGRRVRRPAREPAARVGRFSFVGRTRSHAPPRQRPLPTILTASAATGLPAALCRRSRARRPSRAPASPAAPAASRRRCRARGARAPGRPARRGPRTTSGTPLVGLHAQLLLERHLAEQRARRSRRRAAGRRPRRRSPDALPSGVVKPDMFSTTPMISRSNLRAISAARCATFCAAGCGVVTSSIFACGSSCASVIETSPVPGRQVDQQVVELAPVDVLEELLDRLVQHRPAPHDGGVLLDEEADRHHLHARRRPRSGGSCAARRRAACRPRRACAGCCSPTRRRRARRRSGPRAPARPRGWRSRSTCPRRPCRRPTQITLLTWASAPAGSRLRPSFCCRPAFSSALRTSKATLTPVTPSSADTGLVTACWKWLRIGQPGRRERHHHARRRPASPISIERTMSSSTIERRSSGSITARRLSVTCSVVGILGISPKADTQL